MQTKLGDLNTNLAELVMLGAIPGASRWSKYGAGTVTTEWSTIHSAGLNPGLYQYLTVPEKLGFASTDPDDAFGGTGAETIIVYGLDQDMKQVHEIVQMNGQTPVESFYTYFRISRIINISKEPHNIQGQLYAGPYGGVWIGGEPDNILAHVNDGYNQTQLCIYSVPPKYNLLVYTLSMTCGSKDVEIGAYIRPDVEPSGNPLPVFANKVPYELSAGSSILTNVQNIPFMIPAGAEFEMRGRALLSSTRVTVNVSGLLIPEAHFSEYKEFYL